jgi:6-phosphogluconolactonase
MEPYPQNERRNNYMILKRISVIGSLGLLAAGLITGISTLHGTTSAYAASNYGETAGYVYVLDNTPKINTISTLKQTANGTLTFERTTPIGGQGSGSTLHSQGSLQISADRHWLFAVDAGSNQISAIAIGKDGTLTPKSVVSSGGVDPVSLTSTSNYLYAVNDGDATTPGNVAGFAILPGGKLKSLASATQPLSAANPAPGEISANPQGTGLIVTEKTTNVIDSYHIRYDGNLSTPTFTPATGNTPYGFAFSPVKPSLFVVSDASDGALTAYHLHHGTVSVADGPVADQQAAACWVVVTNDGRFTYTANAVSNSVSGYSLSNKGTLTLLSTSSTGAASAPTETALSSTNHYLYTLDTGTLNISTFLIQGNGKLVPVPASAGIALPASSIGLVAD